MPDGSVYIVRRPAVETDGASVEMEFVLPAGCVPPPPHVHPQQVEEYEVLEGRFDVVVEGKWRTLTPGESATVPIGALHTFRNRSGGVVRVRKWHRPAMRFEDFIERTCETLRVAGVKRTRDPRIFLYLSMVMLEFDETLVPDECVSGFRCRPWRSSRACFPGRFAELNRLLPWTTESQGAPSTFGTWVGWGRLVQGLGSLGVSVVGVAAASERSIVAGICACGAGVDGVGVVGQR
jgi:mannose-6-phosphate isomerase-like protein (cupin superfamily)